MKRYLVVANQTLGGEHLAEAVRERLAAGPCEFHVVVPASPPTDHAGTYTEGEAIAVSRDALDKGLGRMAELGANATGEVGDADPMLAIRDAMIAGSFDEIILSTLPVGRSRWLKLDLPHRVEKAVDVPVIHLEAVAEEG